MFHAFFSRKFLKLASLIFVSLCYILLMMNSAGARVLLCSVFVFLGGFVRAELTAPAHRFFGTHSHVALEDDGLRECPTGDVPASLATIEPSPVLRAVIAAAETSVSSVGAPALHVDESRVVAMDEVVPRTVATGQAVTDPYAWLATMGSLPAAPSLVCDGASAEMDELISPDFAAALTLASADSDH